jgi:hypothetical protein
MRLSLQCDTYTLSLNGWMSLVRASGAPALDAARRNLGEVLGKKLFERPSDSIHLCAATSARRLHPGFIVTIEELREGHITRGPSAGDLNAERCLSAPLLRFLARIRQ